MSPQEFSTEFDVLYNNITSNQAPGLNNYEKSVFLTKAQIQLLLEQFNHRIDSVGGGFDSSEERQIDFSNIIRTESLNHISSPMDYVRIDPRSFIFRVDKQVLHVLNEFLEVTPLDSGVTKSLTVVPLAYDEYRRLMMKPYKYPPKDQAWRLINGSEEGRNHRCFELIAKDINNNTITYRIRYVKRPNPIILEDLSSLGVSVDNQTSVSNCELPEETHHKILERAVTLAKVAWQGSTMTQASMAIEASKR